MPRTCTQYANGGICKVRTQPVRHRLPNPKLLYYTQNCHLNVAPIGLIIMLGGFANMMGNIVGGRISDAIGGRRVMVGASLVATLLYIVIYDSSKKRWHSPVAIPS